MKQLIPLLLFFQAFGVQAQKTVNAVIVSENDHKPLPYSTIKTFTGKSGTYSGEDGRFWIDANDTDTLFISSIGYIPIKILSGQLKDTIFLVVRPLILPSVSVHKRIFVKTIISGILTRKEKVDYTWGPQREDNEIAQRISVPVDTNYVYKIKSVTLSVRRFTDIIPVLLHIYKEDPQTHLPGEDLLLTKYRIQKSNFKKGKIIIELGDENLYIDGQAIYISFQWLGSLPKEKKLDHFSVTAIPMTYSVKDTLTYFTNFYPNQIGWNPLITRDPETLKIRSPNTMFSIELDVYK